MFLVIKKDSIYHEGDERSRTHPGHGYPAYTEEVDRVSRFTDEASLLVYLKRNMEDLRKMEVFRGEMVKINTSINLTIV